MRIVVFHVLLQESVVKRHSNRLPDLFIFYLGLLMTTEEWNN